MATKGWVMLPGSIWGHISCCTEEKHFLPCTAGMKDVLLGVDFGCLTWQMPTTYSPHKLPNTPKVLNLQHQLHSHGYPRSNSPACPLHLLVAWLLVNEWSSGHRWSASRFFCSFEFVVRHWLSWPAGEYPLTIGHPTCNTSDGYTSAETACNYLSNTGNAHCYTSVYLGGNRAQQMVDGISSVLSKALSNIQGG